MKLDDLHTGQTVTLPLSGIEPGRYRLQQAATLNGLVELKAGDILWSDGTSRCELQTANGQRSVSAFTPIPGEQAVAWELVDQGVMTVVEKIDPADPDSRPAPLMPSSLSQLAEPTVFENALEALLQAGHLHEIATHPRMSMRYDTQMLPVSRARRTASGALMRLASRSGDWHRRTLGGVEPARVLAEVSEDEWATYENIVFARLLDQALRLLKRRQRQLAQLLNRQAAALALSQAEDLDYRLRHQLCSLWGQSVATQAPEHDPLQQRLDVLKHWDLQLTQLRFGPLYRAIPRTAWVPVALKNTNVLMHDRHYRQLRPVWQLAHQGETPTQAQMAQRIQQRMTQHQRYSQFVGLLIRHALAACKTLLPGESPEQFLFGPMRLSLQNPVACEWQLCLKLPRNAAKTLTFVAAWAGQGNWESAIDAVSNDERQLVFCHHLAGDDEPSASAEDAVLNPLQFYAVERIKERLERWLYREIARPYRTEIAPLPTALVEALLQQNPQAFERSGNGVRVVRSPDKALNLRELAQQHGASSSKSQELEQASQWLALLATCRVCGQAAQPRDTHANRQGTVYHAVCSACDYEWQLHDHAGTRNVLFQFSKWQKNTDTTNKFRCMGAWACSG